MQIDLVTATAELMADYPATLPEAKKRYTEGYSIFLEDGQWGQLAALEIYLAQHPELGVEYNANVFGAKKQYTEPGSLMSIVPFGVREEAGAGRVIWEACARQCAGIEGVVASHVFVEAIEAAGLSAGFATRDLKVESGDDRQKKEWGHCARISLVREDI